MLMLIRLQLGLGSRLGGPMIRKLRVSRSAVFTMPTCFPFGQRAGSANG